jgi:hypothetical protein
MAFKKFPTSDSYVPLLQASVNSFAEKIKSRTAQVKSLYLALEDNNCVFLKPHTHFIYSLDYRCKAFDDCGVFGGPIADLSEKQVAYLDGLSRQLESFKNESQSSFITKPKF